jgi:hypothetical protein
VEPHELHDAAASQVRLTQSRSPVAMDWNSRLTSKSD